MDEKLALEPLFGQVLLRRINEEERTMGGLVIPGQSKDQQAWKAEVLAVGPGRYTDNVTYTREGQSLLRRPVTDVSPGDVVFVPAFQGYRTTIGMQEYLLVQDTDILAKVRRG